VEYDGDVRPLRAASFVVLALGAGAACAGLLGIDGVSYETAEGGPPDAGSPFDAPPPLDADVNAKIYVIGGEQKNNASDAEGTSNRVYSAPILANGDLGKWSEGGPRLPSSRQRIGAVATPTGILVIGGELVAGGYVPDVLLWPVVSDGGAWIPQAQLSKPRARPGAAGGATAVYVVAGAIPSDDYSNDVQAAPFDDGGGVTLWSTSQPLLPRRGNAAAYANDVLYTVGGDIEAAKPDGGTDFTTRGIEYAAVDAGSVGTFARAASELATGRYDPTVVVHEGKMYVFGGYPPGFQKALATVEVASLDDGGVPGTWASSKPMNNSRAEHCTVQYGDWVYVIGGYQGSFDTPGDPLQSVERGHFNPSGGIDSWANASDLLVGVGRAGCVVFVK
jgi:hypothetical protein